jgi:tape measure domain-containing protein
MAVATQLVAQISVTGASQAQSTFNSLGNASDVLGRKLSSIKPFNAGSSIAGSDVARARLNQLEVQVNSARQRLQTLQGAGNVGESIRNLTTAQARLKLLESDVEKARQQLYKLQDAADAGKSVVGIPEAEAKLAILTNKAAEAREKVAKLENAADAGQSVKGVPEAQAKLSLLEAKFAQAKEKMTQMEAGGREANSGFSLVSSAVQKVSVTLQGMASAATEATTSLGSKLSSGLKSVSSGLLGFLNQTGQTIFNLKQIGQTALQTAQALLQPNIAMEQAKVSFEAFLPNAKAVNSVLNQLYSFAAKTPFSFPEIQSASLKLLNMGVASKDLTKYLTDVGNAVSKIGGGGQMLDDVSMILSQMTNKGKIYTEEMLQLSERNIPSFQLLAGAMHVSVAELQKMITNGEVGRDKIDLLVKAMGQWGNGAMVKQGQTFAGLWATLSDNIGMAWMKMSGPLFETAKKGISSLVDLLSSPAFDKFATQTAKALGDAISFIGKVSTDTVTGIQKFIGALDQPTLKIFMSNVAGLGFELGQVFSAIQGKGNNSLGILNSHLSKLGGPVNVANSVLKGLNLVLSEAWYYTHQFADVLSKINVGGGLDALLSEGEKLGKEFGPSLQNIANLIGGEFTRELKDVSQVSQEFGRFFSTSVVPALKDAEPSFTKLGHVMLDNVVPALFKIRGVSLDVMEHAFKVLGPVVEKIVPPLIRFAGVLASGLGDALKFLMPYFVQGAQAIGKFASEVIDRLGPVLTKIFGDIGVTLSVFAAIWKVIWPGLSQVLAGVWDEIVGVVKIAWALVSGIIKIGLDLLSGNWKQAWEDFKTMLSGVWDGIKTYLGGVWKIIGGIFKAAWDGIKAIWAPIGGWFNDRWKDISKVFANIGGWFSDRFKSGKDGVTNTWGNIGQWFQDRWKDIQNVFAGVGKWFADRATEINAPFKGVEEYIGGVFQTIWNIITALVGRAVAWVSVKWGELTLTARAAWAYLQALIGEYIQAASDKVHSVIGPIVGWLSSKWTEISTNAANLWNGFKQKLSEIWTGAVQIVTDKAGWLGNQLSQKWEGVKSSASNAWKFISDTARQWWGNITKFIGDKANDLKNLILKPFTQARDAIGGILKFFANNAIDQLNNAGSSVVGFLNTFGNALNSVAKALGTEGVVKPLQWNNIKHYATGTSGHPGGPAVLGDGGGPELTMAGGKPYLFGLKGPVLIPDLPAGSTVLPADKTSQLMKSGAFSGIPAYAGGVGDIGPQLWEWAAGGAKSIVDHMISFFHITPPKLPGKLDSMAGQIMSHVKDWAIGWLSKILPDFSPGGQEGGGDFGTPVSGNLRSWILAGMALTHAPMSWFNALSTIAMHESGGNPSAVNNYDINAQNGDPSRGLFQTIGATFARYALPGHGNIFSGIDNTAAAIGYIRARYGDVFHVPGIMALAAGKPYIGYANGGIISEPIAGIGLRTGTRYAFGERGPEMISPLGYMPAGTRAIASSGASSGVTHVHIHTTAELNIDGTRLARMQMPEIVQQIRSATAARI